MSAEPAEPVVPLARSAKMSSSEGSILARERELTVGLGGALDNASS